MYWSEFAEDMVKTIKLGVSAVTVGARLPRAYAAFAMAGTTLMLAAFIATTKGDAAAPALVPAEAAATSSFLYVQTSI
jgi:hypothetical protein